MQLSRAVTETALSLKTLPPRFYASARNNTPRKLGSIDPDTGRVIGV